MSLFKFKSYLIPIPKQIYMKTFITDYFFLTMSKEQCNWNLSENRAAYLDNQFLWHLHREPQKIQGYTQDSWFQ